MSLARRKDECYFRSLKQSRVHVFQLARKIMHAVNNITSKFNKIVRVANRRE